MISDNLYKNHIMLLHAGFWFLIIYIYLSKKLNWELSSEIKIWRKNLLLVCNRNFWPSFLDYENDIGSYSISNWRRKKAFWVCARNVEIAITKILGNYRNWRNFCQLPSQILSLVATKHEKRVAGVVREMWANVAGSCGRSAKQQKWGGLWRKR